MDRAFFFHNSQDLSRPASSLARIWARFPGVEVSDVPAERHRLGLELRILVQVDAGADQKG